MSDWPDKFEIAVIFVDPSMGADVKRGDYSAIVWVGRAKGKLWADADIERRPPSQIATSTVRMYRKYDTNVIVCESNGFQNMIAQLIVDELLKQGLGRPPVLRVASTMNKTLRITDGLDPYLANHDIHIRDTVGGRLLLEQLRDFPIADHDDGPDALDGAVRQLSRLAAEGIPE